MDAEQAAVTEYPEINKLLEQLSKDIQKVLGMNLIGLYLYGSLVWGDFDIGISDIDLMAATAKDLSEGEFAGLKDIQEAVCRNNPEFDNRIEIAYISLKALRTFKTQRSQIAIVSPGEPFHIKEAGYDWLINWYNVQEKAIILFGPSPKEIIEPISKGEFIDAVKAQAVD
jgi:cobalamin biosynthesis Co2+ chelatase CbiK